MPKKPKKFRPRSRAKAAEDNVREHLAAQLFDAGCSTADVYAAAAETSPVTAPRQDVLGDAIRVEVFKHAQNLADGIFERIESRIGTLVAQAARRIVPENTRDMIDTVVNIRTAAFFDKVHALNRVVSGLEARLVDAGLVKERATRRTSAENRYGNRKKRRK